MTTVPMRNHKVVLEPGSYVLNYSLISNDVLSVEDNLDLNSHLWYLHSILTPFPILGKRDYLCQTLQCSGGIRSSACEVVCSST